MCEGGGRVRRTSEETSIESETGYMKRMVAGAVSDIPAHNLPINPRVYLDTQVKLLKKASSLTKLFAGRLLGLCDGPWQLSVDVPL